MTTQDKSRPIVEVILPRRSGATWYKQVIEMVRSLTEERSEDEEDSNSNAGVNA